MHAMSSLTLNKFVKRVKLKYLSIVSESGRAIVAPHSILIFEAVDRISRDEKSSMG
jgi:arginine decarboxylase-like protein